MYQWEFAGPTTSDFIGTSTLGQKRDAGAFQYKTIAKPHVSPKVTLKSLKPKKLTTRTKKITGKTTARATVKLMRGSKKIKSVRASAKGVFTMKKLKLKKYKKKILKLVISKNEHRGLTKTFKKIKK